MERALRHIKITYKQGIVAGFMLAGMLAVLVVVLSSYRAVIFEARINSARAAVQLAYNIVQTTYNRAASGVISQDEAQESAKRELRNLRYGNDEYFWINDMHPRMVMHPFQPDLEGSDLADYHDEEGTYLFREMVAVVKAAGEGTVHYHWYRPGEEGVGVREKTSYVKGFAPWGWIIGSGVYIDDVDVAWRELIAHTGGILIVIFIISAGLIFLVVRSTAKPIEALARQVEKLADGTDVEIDGTDRRDEIGDIARALHMFKEKMKVARRQERRIRLHEKKAEKSMFVLRIKEKALARRIREKETLERQLQTSIAEAKAANAAKSEFLANMSHELRTPLNSILGMLRFLQESPLEEKQKYMAATAFRSSVSLLETVNDILDLSKIESGEMRLESIGFDPLYVVESTMQVLDQPAAEKHLRLVRGYAGLSLPYVVGDPTRFGRVLTNLAGNAVKYTDYGHVEVTVSYEKTDDTHIVLRCDIADTGIGIAEDKRGAIFEKFVQADTSTTRKYGGSGLGLCITKQLVEAMGGTISVRSTLGVGSTFTVSMPFEVTNRLHEEKSIRREKMLCGVIPVATARVLIAEDHALNQIMMKTIMERFGIVNYRMASTGADAVMAWRHEPWDVILMDCHMPEKNGYDATIDIRRLEQERGSHVPIVAMTANAMVGDREKCLRCGMDGYISKPVDIDELQETLGQWIKFEAKEPPVAVPAEADDDAVLDLEQLRSLTQGDAALEREVFILFAEQTNLNLVTMREVSTADGVGADWSDAAHMVKGAAANIGAVRLARLAGAAQHYKGDATGRRVLLARIEAAYAELLDCLRTAGLYS